MGTTASAPNGLTQVTEFDDVANTVTTGLTPKPGAGLLGALRTNTKVLDDAGRETKTTGARRDGVSVPEATQEFDGLGRTKVSTSNSIATTVERNADGTPAETTMTPVDPDATGGTVTAERTHDMLGASTHKTLTRTSTDESGAQGASVVSTAGVTRVLDAAGRTAQTTDQAGNTTGYAYTVDGFVSEVVEDASNTVTSNTYDPVTRL